jgi:hypothetical protein
MENNKNENIDKKVKATSPDEKHQSNPVKRENNDKTEQNETGKLPDDEIGTDHNSDPYLAKKQ